MPFPVFTPLQAERLKNTQNLFFKQWSRWLFGLNSIFLPPSVSEYDAVFGLLHCVFNPRTKRSQPQFLIFLSA